MYKMKNKILSLLVVICVVFSCCVTTCSFASSSLELVSDIYKVTYNNPLYDGVNTVSDIPMNTTVNTLLYNLRKDNPGSIIDIVYSDGKIPALYSKISDYSTTRMYIIVRSNNTDDGDRFVLLPSVYSQVSEDFENYAIGTFVSDSAWNYTKTRDNIGMGYIACDADSNRFFRNAAPAAGDSDYSESSDSTISALGTKHLCAPEGAESEIFFRLRNHNSRAYVRLRDCNTTSTGHVLQPIYNLHSNLTCFYSTTYAKDSNGNNLTFADDEWIDFRIVIDRKTENKVFVYVNDSGAPVASLSLSNFPDFEWNDFRLSFNMNAGDAGNLRAQCDVDDFRFGIADDSDNGSLVKKVNVYSSDPASGFEYAGAVISGDNKIKLTLDTSKLTSASKIYAAEKSDGELISLSVVDIPESLSGTAYLPVELNVKNAGESKVELYIWQNDTLTPYGAVISTDMSDISKAVSNDHPRVLATAEKFGQIKSDGSAELKEKVLSYAEQICESFPAFSASSEFYVGDDASFSDVANKVKKYGPALGMAYQLEADAKYAQKLFDILTAASLHTGWTDGTVSNLTVAYMTEGFSLGFDWCYDGLTIEQRQTIADIAIEKCLGFAKDEYQNKDRGSHTWSVTYTNHNPIPTSSFITGSIAFAEYNPQLCQMVLDYSSQRLKIFLAGLFPDGGWWEGSMYTNLLYSHLAKASETLKINFGVDNVIASNHFINNTPDFFMGLMGPMGTHNLAEEKTVVTTAIPEMLWLANITSRPDVRAWASQKINLDNASNCILALIWGLDNQMQGSYTFENNYTRAIEHITLGTGSEGDALWLSVLGGVNMGSHKHLDLGSFIYDYNGVRWATEFGCEDYYKGYHAEKSSEKIFYRSRAEGHNTLEINPTSASGGQRMNDENGVSKAEVVKYDLRKTEPYAVYDMSTAYSDNAAYVKRGFRLLEDNKGFVVRDEFSTLGDEDIVNWYMHTDAVITISEDGKSATLTQDGKTMKLTALEDDLTLSVADAITPEPILTELLAISKSEGLELSKQKKNQGNQKIKITRIGGGEGTITVVLSAEDADVPADASLSLDNWQ